MIASTVITVASLPVYSIFYKHFSAVGLAIASDIGIAANCLAIACLLHRRRLVPFSGLAWNEIAKAFGIALCAGLISLAISRIVPLHGGRIADVEALGLIAVAWSATVVLGLWITKSSLLRDLRSRGSACV
jgi:peptidoglycan biosynthesis protein MviN/MurJ (putative lipid II flippase)